MLRETDKLLVFLTFKRKEVSLERGGNRCSGVESEKGTLKTGESIQTQAATPQIASLTKWGLF